VTDLFNEQHIRESVRLVCELLGFSNPQLTFHLPPPIDDFQVTRRLVWGGLIDDVHFGGYYLFMSDQKIPYEAHFVIVRRIIFDVLITKVPYRRHVYQAISLWRRFPQGEGLYESLRMAIISRIMRYLTFWRYM